MEEPSGPRKPLALRGGRKVAVCLQYAEEGYVQLPPGGQPTDGRCRRAEKLTVQHLPFLSVYIPEIDEVISCTFLTGSARIVHAPPARGEHRQDGCE